MCIIAATAANLVIRATVSNISPPPCADGDKSIDSYIPETTENKWNKSRKVLLLSYQSTGLVSVGINYYYFGCQNH